MPALVEPPRHARCACAAATPTALDARRRGPRAAPRLHRPRLRAGAGRRERWATATASPSCCETLPRDGRRPERVLGDRRRAAPTSRWSPRRPAPRARPARRRRARCCDRCLDEHPRFLGAVDPLAATMLAPRPPSRRRGRRRPGAHRRSSPRPRASCSRVALYEAGAAEEAEERAARRARRRSPTPPPAPGARRGAALAAALRRGGRRGRRRSTPTRRVRRHAAPHRPLFAPAGRGRRDGAACGARPRAHGRAARGRGRAAGRPGVAALAGEARAVPRRCRPPRRPAH